MPAAISLDNTWGVVLIGVFLAICHLGTHNTSNLGHELTILLKPLKRYGILTLQTFSYYQRYPNDRRYLKAVVGSIWILETFHIILVTYMIYEYLVTGFGDYAALQRNTWSFNMHVGLTTIVACISQIFFVFRCWMLDRSTLNTIVSLFILGIAVIQLAFGMTCTALTFVLKHFSEFQRYTWAVGVWLGAAALCDILVSAAIVRSLWRSRTGISRTNSLITRLILWTINTGIITSLWAILDIAAFSGAKDTLIHLFFNVMLAKLYANSLLATLNNRRTSEESSGTSQNISLSNVSSGRAFVARQGDSKLSGVHVMTHTVQDVSTNTQSQYSQNMEAALSSVDDKTSDWPDCKNTNGDKISLNL
ncbi:hypothetical protein BU17DRAFT_83261 [Hysterangium stoloniferum]|nr:hypothetical protein BU17DRAFT_83261 [Hysterangium stoloniferum]